MFKKKFPSLSSLGSDGNTAFLRAARAGHLDKVLDHLKNNVDINTCNANGLNALHLASKDGHIQVVQELLKRGANVDSATKKGNTALHIASLAGQEEVVKLLVEHGAAVNVQSQNGFTPLYMAAQENHDNVVKFLLANGANQSLATEDGFTPLAVAMQQGHDKVVAVLLENDTRGKVRLPALHIAAKKDDCKAAALLLQSEHNPDVTSKSGFTPLHIASHYGNEGIANLLLTKGADVNYSAKHNITPLHVAAKWGKSNMVALLLDRGANIEAKTRDGLTPLHCAARSGHEQVVDMLLERGAPISAKTKNGLAPLHMSSQGDHVDAARILLYHRAPVDDVTVDYLTALHVAAHCGHVAVARLLLDRKADPNARALNGFTPLHIACKKNRIKVVELLLKHGASIEATTESGLTPLHVASFMGCMNIVIYLVQNEANPNVTTVRGETPLHLAARANQTDIIRILLRNGAKVDARAREQQTPLHIASRLGNVDIVMLLLQHGANVDSTTKDLYTALHIAAKEGQDEVASVLLENGASLEATTKKGFTPLHLAAKYGNMKVAKLLLQRDAPVDAQGKNGVTPLHVASHYDHQNVALLLLDKGASPHAIAKNGHTPLHIAARKNQMDIATTLLEYGAKANSESKAGFTPLHLASQEGHTDMASLLIEHQADTNHKAKNGLTPLHLCAQEDRVDVGSVLIKCNAEIDATTKAGYTPLHVASHFGQMGMVKLLLTNGASVTPTTAVNYTPLHQAAQQGHNAIVSTLLEAGAEPNSTTNQGQTALSIAQKLGYISVVETLKGVTESSISPTTIEEKYKVVAPETMQETFMSDSEDEGGEDTLLSEQPYHYLTVDEMKSLGDDSLPIDVTRDERIDNRDIMGPPKAIDDTISPQHVRESYSQFTVADNIDITKQPVHVGFLVSFLVDARGGAMRGCRHSGVRVIVPPRRAPMPLRVTCRYLKRDKMAHPPPLMEGEALASRILELGPVGAKFLGPVMIEVPHFGSLRGKEREIVILRSDNGETWREHTFEASDEAVQDILSHSFDKEELSQLEESSRTTRILTTEFPHYLAVVSRIRQEVHAIGPEGGMVSSTVVPQVQAVFPQGALTKKIKVGLQAQPISAELTAKLLGNRVAVSPIVTVEPRRRKFHKPITLTIPVPQAANKGMINQYSGDAPTLRLLCSITGGTTRAQWEDVTGSTPLTFVNDCVSFTTTVSARFWLMDCRNISDATKMATELYREAIHVPFMAKFVVFAKRVDPTEARLRVFCMTDDKEDKTLEHQEQFTEVAKSRDVEVLEGKLQYVEFAGNLVPVTKSGEQLKLIFRAFKENRLPFTVRVKDPHADAIGRTLFMKEAKVSKGDVPQHPICILNIVLPDNIIPETGLPDNDETRLSFIKSQGGMAGWQRLSDISNLLEDDWVRLASQLGLSTSEINHIKTELCESSVPHQALAMLKLWIQTAGNKASASTMEEALLRIGRDDIVQHCAFRVDQSGSDIINEDENQIQFTKTQRIETYLENESIKDTRKIEEQERNKKKGIDKDDKEERKYIAEEKEVEEVKMSVSERRKEIEKRLSQDTDEKKKDKQLLPDQKYSESKTETKANYIKILDDSREKEISEEKAISPEPAHLPFDEKLKTFELGIAPKDKTKVESLQKFIQEEQRATDYQDTSDEESLSFQEKRLSFEKGLTMKKPGDKIGLPEKRKAERSKVADGPESDSYEKDAAPQIRDQILYSEPSLDQVEQDVFSPKVSKTPPPSPAEFSKDTIQPEWQSTEMISGVLQEDGQSKLDRSILQSPTTGDTTQKKGYQSTECGFEGISDSTPPKPSPRFPLKETSIDKITDLVAEDQDYAAKKMFWETVSSTDMIKSQKQEPHVPVPRPRLSLSSSTSKPGEADEGDWKVGYSDVSTLSETSEIDYEPKHTSIPTTEKTVVPELTKECTISQEIDSDSEIEYLQKMKDHLVYDNIGFNEDDEDVASLKKITETKRRVFERSISLPAENIGDTSISSVRVKKRIFEAQIKKEMVVEQLMSQPEEVSSPEHKALWQKEPLVTDSEEMISRQIHSHIFSHELEDQGELSLPEDKGILASQDQNVYTIPTHDSKDAIDQTYIESLQLKEDITTMKTKEEILHYVDDKDKSLSLSSTVAEVFQYKNGARTKPSDSLEVHIDKSELEGTEKDKDIDDFIGIEDTGDEASKHFVQDAKTQMHISESKLKHGSRTSSPGESEDTFSESDVTPEDTRFKEQDVQEWGPSEKDVEQESYPVKDGEKKICTPEEHVPNIVWEVPVQQGVENIQEEISQSIVSEYSTCSKKISEVGEKVDELTEEDARKIATYVVENIEAEIAMRSALECTSETIPPESGDYVQDLKKSSEQDNYENELSLTKKVPQQMKFVRTDTTTSSMEITDEDLRSSGVETDISPLESQACKLIQHLDDTSESDSTKEFDNQDLENQDSFSEDVVEKTLAEVRESLEAVKEELIEEKKKKKDSITKESPSEFEFTVLAQGTRISESIQESHSEDSGIFASIKTKLGEVDYQSSENEISTRQFLSEIESKKDTTVKNESDEYIVTSKVKEDVKTLDSKEDVINAAESTVVTQESSIIQEKNQGLAILSDEQQASMQSKHEEATIISKSGVQRKILDEESKELENRSKEIYDVSNQFTITEGQEYFSKIKQKEEGKVIDTKSKVSSSKEESEHKSKDFISVTKTSTEKSHISTTSTLESKEHSKSVYEVTSVFEIDPEGFEQMKAIGSLQTENISEKIVKKDVHRTYSTDSQKSSLEDDSIGKKTSDESQMCDKSSISGQKSTGETTILKTSDLKSVTDTEHYSSSGESYYQSFEQTSESARTPSRPCSSDVEGLIAHIGVITGSSEYESAMSHETSGQSTSMTSHEFHTAKSSLSSRASMKSLDSESSGNLASVEISSEASETLVPSALELEKDMETFPTQTDDESNLYHPEAQEIQMSKSHMRGKTFSESVSFEISADDMSEDESDEQCNVETEVSKKMKRSFEMTFQPEPRPIGSESTFSEITSQDDKRESSLDDVGSLIMLSDSSGLKTVISKLDSEGFDDSMASDQLCPSLSGPSVQHDFKDSKELQETFSGEIRQESTSTQYSSQMGTVDSVTLSTSTVNEFGQQSVSTQITSQSEDKSKTSDQSNGPTQVDYNVEYDEDSVDVDTKKRPGHRRNGSMTIKTPMTPVLSKEIKKPDDIIEDSAETDRYIESILIHKEEQLFGEKDAYEAGKSGGEAYQVEVDQGLHQDFREETVFDDICSLGEKRETEMPIDLDTSFQIDIEQGLITKGFSDDRPDSELIELMKQFSSDAASEDPIERPKSPEPAEECELKDDTPEFSSEAQASITELEMEYCGAFSRANEYISPIHEKTSVVHEGVEHNLVQEYDLAETEILVDKISSLEIKKTCKDLADEKHELETLELIVKESKGKQVGSIDTSPGHIPDITITEHMTPVADKSFHFTDLENQEIVEDNDFKQTSSPQTPASISSKASSETETDQGCEYVLDDPAVSNFIEESDIQDEVDLGEISHTTEERTVFETKNDVKSDHDSMTDSPNSDSFEMLEKPDISEEFVIIEEIGKEAKEQDSEGKGVKIEGHVTIRKAASKPDIPVPKSVTTKMTDIKYFSVGANEENVGAFAFEPGSPSSSIEQQRVTEPSEGSPPSGEENEYENEVEAGKKWMEMQFQGEHAVAVYGYDIEFERGPLEDIKEEDANDLESSSRIGSMGSQISHSIGSFGSVKESLSSTPDYDVLAGRKFFTRSGEHDDVSMSSLQEFERLEHLIAMESVKSRSLGSQDSLTSSSNSKKQGSRSGGDDVSLASLKEFEGLESACIAAESIEKKAKAEEESLLSEIEEGHESQASESESCLTISGRETNRGDSDEDDYEKRMFEIDEIIRQAQANVENFIDSSDRAPDLETLDSKVTDKTDSLGRADSVEDVSKVPDLDLDQPLYNVPFSSKDIQEHQWKELDEELFTSTDSLELKTQVSKSLATSQLTTSTDSLDTKTSQVLMATSPESLESFPYSKPTVIDVKTDDGKSSLLTSTDSLEMDVHIVTRVDSTDDEEPQNLAHDQSSSSGKEGDLSSSGKEDSVDGGAFSGTNRMPPPRAELMLGSTDSLEPTSSTATHATYQYETDSIMSSSFTSGDSNTMVSSTENIESAGGSGVWFEDGKPYVTEVIEPGDDDFSHIIHRTVEMPPEIRKVSFTGPEAEIALQEYIENFSPGEDMTETQETDDSGNVHITRIIQRRVVIRPDELGGNGSDLSGPQLDQFLRSLTKDGAKDTSVLGGDHNIQEEVKPQPNTSLASQEPPYSTEAPFNTYVIQQTTSTHHATPHSEGGSSIRAESYSKDTSEKQLKGAQIVVRPPLKYDISMDDETECDPREHDWRFNLQSHLEGEEERHGQAKEHIPKESGAHMDVGTSKEKRGH